MRSWVRVLPSALNLVVIRPTYPCTKLIFPLLPCRCETQIRISNRAFIDMDHIQTILSATRRSSCPHQSASEAVSLLNVFFCSVPPHSPRIPQTGHTIPASTSLRYPP